MMSDIHPRIGESLVADMRSHEQATSSQNTTTTNNNNKNHHQMMAQEQKTTATTTTKQGKVGEEEEDNESLYERYYLQNKQASYLSLLQHLQQKSKKPSRSCCIATTTADNDNGDASTLSSTAVTATTNKSLSSSSSTNQQRQQQQQQTEEWEEKQRMMEASCSCQQQQQQQQQQQRQRQTKRKRSADTKRTILANRHRIFNIFLTGPPGSGKTTQLQLLQEYVSNDCRLVLSQNKALKKEAKVTNIDFKLHSKKPQKQALLNALLQQGKLVCSQLVRHQIESLFTSSTPPPPVSTSNTPLTTIGENDGVLAAATVTSATKTAATTTEPTRSTAATVAEKTGVLLPDVTETRTNTMTKTTNATVTAVAAASTTTNVCNMLSATPTTPSSPHHSPQSVSTSCTSSFFSMESSSSTLSSSLASPHTPMSPLSSVPNSPSSPRSQPPPPQREPQQQQHQVQQESTGNSSASGRREGARGEEGKFSVVTLDSHDSNIPLSPSLSPSQPQPSPCPFATQQPSPQSPLNTSQQQETMRWSSSDSRHHEQCDNDDDDDDDDTEKPIVWVYSRGPSSMEQAKYLYEYYGIAPDIYIVLEVSSVQSLIDRVKMRRIDPLTQKTYHLKHDKQLLMNDAELRERLVHRNCDDERLYMKRMSNYRNRMEPVMAYYEQVNREWREMHHQGHDDEGKRVEVVRIDASRSARDVWVNVQNEIQRVMTNRNFAVGATLKRNWSLKRKVSSNCLPSMNNSNTSNNNSNNGGDTRSENNVTVIDGTSDGNKVQNDQQPSTAKDTVRRSASSSRMVNSTETTIVAVNSETVLSGEIPVTSGALPRIRTEDEQIVDEKEVSDEQKTFVGGGVTIDEEEDADGNDSEMEQDEEEAHITDYTSSSSMSSDDEEEGGDLGSGDEYDEGNHKSSSPHCSMDSANKALTLTSPNAS